MHTAAAPGAVPGAPPAADVRILDPNRRRNAKSESYGFALYIFATVLWIFWIVWAASPEWLLTSVGITWFPNRCVRR